MYIQLNGVRIETQETNLVKILLEQGYPQEAALATAVNGQFVAKANRERLTIVAGDEIEVVAPMQGG